MWQIVKRFIVFQSKTLEFRYRTWQSKRDIRRAYREGSVGKRLFKRTMAYARFGLIIAVIALAVALIVPTVPKIFAWIVSAQKASQQAAIKRAPKKPVAVAGVPKPVMVRDTVPLVKKEPPAAANADTVKSVQPKQDTSGLLQYCILANKSNKTVYLLYKNMTTSSWDIAAQFPAVMGRNEGQKQSAGDRRTPEGEYFIVGRKEKSELNELYGPLAYVLNYPNEEDRQAGRTGQGIWIHGMPEDSNRMVTRGCIVMQNTYLLELEKFLKLGVGTPVVIVDKSDISKPQAYPDYARIEQKRKYVLNEYVMREHDFKSILEGWQSAWASRNIATYSQFYDAQRFFSSGMSWNAWRDRKKSIFQTLESIQVSVDNIRLVDCSESTAVVVFRQQYAASNQAAKQNAKRLCFYKNNGHWLIYREETFSTEEFLL